MLKRRMLRVAGLCVLFSAIATLSIRAEEPAADAEAFIRVERNDAAEPVALQTAIVRFTPINAGEQDLAVDLVAALHVGEKEYYEALNQAFSNYDVVLYELVAAAGTRVPQGTKAGGNALAGLQNGLKNLLSVEHQLECIDYTKENLVHADMSPEEFAESMRKRGESFWTMFFQMMGQSMAQQSQQGATTSVSDVDLLIALFDGDRGGKLKSVFAEQIAGGSMDAFDGPQGSTIITERNKVALAALKEQIAKGHKRIAIFYGAAHMPDFSRHLLADFELHHVGAQWVTAWHLHGKPEPSKNGDQ